MLRLHIISFSAKFCWLVICIKIREYLFVFGWYLIKQTYLPCIINAFCVQCKLYFVLLSPTMIGSFDCIFKQRFRYEAANISCPLPLFSLFQRLMVNQQRVGSLRSNPFQAVNWTGQTIHIQTKPRAIIKRLRKEILFSSTIGKSIGQAK